MKTTVIYLFIANLLLTFPACKINGCMDPGAINYNPKANEEDGSCEYSMVGVWEEFEVYYISYCDVGASPQNPNSYVSASTTGFKITINSDNSYSGERCNGNNFTTNNSTGLVNMDCGGVMYFNRSQSPFASEVTIPSAFSGNILYLNYNHSTPGCLTKTPQYRYRKL